MEVSAHTRIEIQEPSQVGSARRTAGEIARDAGLGETDAGRVALVATEVASNVVKHGGGGEVLLRSLGESAVRGVEIVGIDAGPGMRSVAASIRDGFSTAGTPGTGLGAIARLADLFDVHTAVGGGTVLLARVHEATRGDPPSPPAPAFGAICVAMPREEVSGDGWAIVQQPGRSAVLVIDGLGHGLLAHEAARAGTRLFERAASEAPAEIVARLHAGLRATRGAALAVAVADHGKGVVHYAGIGNVSGTILCDGTTRSLVSHHGTAGHDSRRIQEFAYPFAPDATLVMNSDGLVSSWSVDRYPGLLERHPTVVAAVLHRDFTRGRDDATTFVLRGKV